MMRNRDLKRRLAAIAVLVLVLFLPVSGCSGNGEDRTDSEYLSSVNASGEENTDPYPASSEEETDPGSEKEDSTTTSESEEISLTDPEASEDPEALLSDSSEEGEDGTSDPSEGSEDYPETEELTEDPAITEGLSNFFRQKLTVDPGKTKSYLNVRRYPSEDSEILAILFPNEVTSYLSKRGDWYEVPIPGMTGYVNAGYVLTDSRAYEASKHNIGYAAMMREFDTVLYETPDTESQGIRLADKADVYTVSGVTGEFFRLDVISEYVDHLYVLQDQVVLFYQFLGPNTVNGMDEGTEDYLGSFDLGDYQAELDLLSAQAETEKVEREELRRIREEEERIAEAERRAAEEAALQSSVEASIQAVVASMQAEQAALQEEEARRASIREAEEAYRASVEQSMAAAEQERASREQAQEEERIRSSEAVSAGIYDQAKNAERERKAFYDSHGGMTSADVRTSGTYAVTLDQAIIDYTVDLCSGLGLDPAVVFSVIYHESRFHANSVNSGTSAAGTYGREGMSYGLMQIIPIWNKARITANNISYPDGLYDPYNNILVGVSLLYDHGAASDWVSALAKFRSGLNDTGYHYAYSVLSLAGCFDVRN